MKPPNQKYLYQEVQARHVETSRLRAEITGLRDELCQRDEEHNDEIKHYKDTLVRAQRELEAVK